MKNCKVLKDVTQIDLLRDGVIEAHAGTGKTYTIVQLVLRILQEAPDGGPAVHIRDILLVTFTEKAAGELKKRIREGLQERLSALRGDPAANPDHVEHLESCLNNLHEALIGTIHSVCLRLLRTWPFETGVHFETEIVDDDEELGHALRESIRTDWQDEATNIPWALDALERRGVRLEAKHFDLVRKTARELLDEEYAVLDRTAVGGCSLKELATILEGDARACRDIPCAADFRNNVEGCIDVMRRIIDDPGTHFASDDILNEFRRRIGLWEKQLETGIDAESFTRLKTYAGNKRIKTSRTKEHPLFAELERFYDTMPSHNYLSSLRGDTVPLALVCDAAGILAKRWNRDKRERGLVSYDDMLRLMHAAVRGNGEFLRSFRGRLRFGIIDEFQDTSAVQWKIFEKVFLDAGDGGERPRLFIVGDPKQSIYAFQGADVRSYLDARDAIVSRGGIIYYLDRNYRSTGEILSGYNEILRPDGERGDWFSFGAEEGGGISYPSPGEAGELARPPDRAGKPANALKLPSVQAVVLEGSASARRDRMAALAAEIIGALKGTRVSIPDGREWRDISLDYGDFAVVVETHAMAQPFLDRMHRAGIPATKYKLEGVFQSPMARDIHALLRAILNREGDPAPRLAALLTHFFNRRPRDIDPEKDLEECAAGDDCAGDGACMAHCIREWAYLADRLQWARLFRSIQERTGVRERLIRLLGGERHLADLRQVTDHCIEKLYRENLDLGQLVEHLGRLVRGEESVGRDRNLYTLATEKSSVKVLTIHAAKGLEFPVVFVMTGISKGGPKGPGVIRVTGIGVDGENKRHVKSVVPFLEAKDLDMPVPGEEGIKKHLERRQVQERRRLLYVAMTRPQALLFVPVHLERAVRGGDGAIDYGESKPRDQYEEKDLSPRLCGLLKRGLLTWFDAAELKAPARAAPGETAKITAEGVPAAVPDIDMGPFLCRQTSYTQLSHSRESARDEDRSEEPGEFAEEAAPASARARQDLPGGRKTGDALHRALEDLLRKERVGDVLGDGDGLGALVQKYLDQNGVLGGLVEPDARARAVSQAAAFIRAALTAPLTLPGDSVVVLAGLGAGCRVPEMEFLLSAGPHWIHGYMDLVFRVENPGAAHPWRYFVLDWKSDALAAYDRTAVDACIIERHYDLQARIYCHALHRHLAGLLGTGYDPRENLGGAVYVFLRGYDPASGGGARQWVRQADPEGDADFVRAILRD